MQLQGLELLSASGFAQYEVSAHAQSGRQCRHNLHYWTFGDYLGIGAGAHGKRRDPATGRTWRQAKPRQPTAYLQALGSPDPVGSRWMLKDEDLVLEFAMNALRLTEGFDRRRFTQRTGLDLDRLAAPLSSSRGGRAAGDPVAIGSVPRNGAAGFLMTSWNTSCRIRPSRVTVSPVTRTASF